ncbi:MAG: rhomboid family intramembrane serine protease, partial [Bacteroidota bacterium]
MKIDAITLIVIAANVLFSIKGFNDFSFFERYKFQTGAIQRGERLRMITSGFLHVDVTHLLFNMITLFFFAGVVISYFGAVKFL